MTDIGTELKNHLICEFMIRNLSPSVLLETRGVFNNVDSVVEALLSMCERQIRETFKGGEVTKTYYDRNVLNGISTFFSDFKIHLTTRDGKECKYSGGAKPSSIQRNGKTKEVYCVPDIKLTIEARDENEMHNILSFCLAHELTHCYNMFQYTKEHGGDVYGTIDRQRYSDIMSAMGLGNKQLKRGIAAILYTLNRMERNAYIAQLRQELLAVKDKMYNDSAMLQLIKNTESYKNVEYLERQMAEINESNPTEEEKNEVVKYVNEIMDKSFTNYNQVKKYFNNRWIRWKKAYIVKSVKIAYDIYKDTEHSKWLDWGAFGKDKPNIKDCLKDNG